MAYPSHNSTLAIRITRFFSLALYQSRRGIHDHHHRHHFIKRPATPGGFTLLAGVFRATDCRNVADQTPDGAELETARPLGGNRTAEPGRKHLRGPADSALRKAQPDTPRFQGGGFSGPTDGALCAH